MHTDPTPLIREYPRSDPRLGRKLQLDARSLPYMVTAADPRTLRSVHWPRRLPILDQGPLGACVGFTMASALGTYPLSAFPQLRGVVGSGTEATDFAQGLYSEATAIDPWEGTWPPEDTGTDGLSAAKVLKRRGLISGYRHASSLAGLLTLLQDGPVAMGMPWHEGFFEPDEDGRIDTDGRADTPMVGGHEVLVVGVVLDPSGHLDQALLTVANSWSPGWGDRGYFRMAGALYERLRSDVDLIQLKS